MSNYTFPYASSFPYGYQNHGDGIDQYYGLPSDSKRDHRYCKDVKKQYEVRPRSRSMLGSRSRSKTRSRSATRSLSRTRSRSETRSRSSCSLSSARRDQAKLEWSEPKFADAFRVLYLTKSKAKNNTSKYLVIKKKQDRIKEFLKRDGLGSKHWFFYPRPKDTVEKPEENVQDPQRNCDKRIKVDADFFKKCKRTKNLDTSGPISKLKTWELIFYKKLGFIQAV